jgi:hypothetical protein
MRRAGEIVTAPLQPSGVPAVQLSSISTSPLRPIVAERVDMSTEVCPAISTYSEPDE